VRDVRSNLIPHIASLDVLAIGLGYLLLNDQWLESAFYLSAIWGSRGGMWRLPILMLAVLLLAQGLESFPFVIGVLYVLAIFELGWFGGGDSQLAFGLVAIGRDWRILSYLFRGTILLAFVMMFCKHGFVSGLKRSLWVSRNMRSPDWEAIKLPWAILVSLGGLTYIWVFPGLK
jgi:Flp pilus assembly protein protease CpaA